jgi:hypothetical protein
MPGACGCRTSGYQSSGFDYYRRVVRFVSQPGEARISVIGFEMGVSSTPG